MKIGKALLDRLLFRPKAAPPSPEPPPPPEPLEEVPYYVQRGRENESAVLEALARFGWLSSAQIGMLVWAGYAQPQRMAQRTLARLCSQDCVLRREVGQNMVVYVLTLAGTRRLAEAGIEAVPGTDLRLRWWRHRYAANTFLIHLLSSRRASEIVTEYEVLREAAPAEFGPFLNRGGKVPDGVAVGTTIVRERDRPPGFENPKRVRCRLWVELELSRRRPSDARQIGELIAGWDSRGHDRIGLVYPVQARRPEDYARAAKALRATIKAARKAWVESRSHTPDLMVTYVFPMVDVFLIHLSAQLRFESVVKLGSLGMVTAYRYDLRRLEHSSESEPLHHLVEASRAQSSF